MLLEGVCDPCLSSVHTLRPYPQLLKERLSLFRAELHPVAALPCMRRSGTASPRILLTEKEFSPIAEGTARFLCQNAVSMSARQTTRRLEEFSTLD